MGTSYVFIQFHIRKKGPEFLLIGHNVTFILPLFFSCLTVLDVCFQEAGVEGRKKCFGSDVKDNFVSPSEILYISFRKR